jgi:hypothetical protein
MALMPFRLSFPLLARWRALPAWPALWLVLALLWAPIWGQWHGIAHQVRQALAAPAVVASMDAAPVAAAQWVGDADEGHAPSSSLCQVLDHLGHASALSAWPVLAVFLSLPAAAPDGVAHLDPLARADWKPQARAPPHWI